MEHFDTIAQLGVGGIFALLIIREVFKYQQQKKHTNGSSGERSVDFWKAEITEAVNAAIEAKRILQQLDEIKWTQKSDLEVIRTKFHDANGEFEKIALALALIQLKLDTLKEA